jgi:hypothetical protein
MILRGDAACEKTGIPSLHAEAFQEVADATNNVISSRAVGIYATGLILENYASKGFHNKAKSCNWGPMAGFVLDDPRFTKVGDSEKGRADQLEALLHAIDEHAIEVPLFISDDRRQWLLKKRLYTYVDRDSDSFLVRGTAPWGLTLDFKLIRHKPEGANEKMWGVLYRKADRQSARNTGHLGHEGWIPVMAMRDPMCTITATNYRAATTGDYDLFAIWTRKGQYDPNFTDKRMVSHATLEANIRNKVKDTGEDIHKGNLTPRIANVRHRLNNAIIQRGYIGGNMVHHSDEGGRPFVGDVDLPIFAVVPGRSECFALESVLDLREFITAELNREYALMFSPGWMKQLVFGADVKKAKALHEELLAKTANRR